MGKFISFNKQQALYVNFQEINYSKNTDLTMIIAYPVTTPVACLLFVHGGAWKGGDADMFRRHIGYATNFGFVGVSINYRLNNGDCDIRDGLKDCTEALFTVRRIIYEKYKKHLKIVALGDSAGGYYAVCLGSQKTLSLVNENAKIVDFVVDFNGIVDLTGKWRYGINADDETARKYSPLYNVTKGDAPVLIMHGDEDKTVDIADAFAYEKALKEKGVECETQIIRGAAHAFILFDYRRDNELVAETLQFVMKKLKAICK